ncbi:PEGA domain-containing protein [Sorangium sp. So ce1182]|uniref:PEGA domain-containing protein n=1 Tax=Sorangium sp. So ce1182 TaxID=3133334 RepID=UPI003F632037
MGDAMRNLTMHLTGAALCALCAFAPAAALAQASPPGATPAGEDEARGDNARAAQLYRQGNDAFTQKRWPDAELLYLKAWALVRSFDIAANLGEVQLQLKKPRSAATFLAFALRTAPPSAKPEQIARMRHFLDEAKAQVGTVRVRVKNAADAEVFVDGERVADAEVKHEVYLEPGPHELLIRRAGYEEEVVRLVAGPGVTETIAQGLKPKAVKASEAAATGTGAKVPGSAAPGAMGTGAAGAPVLGGGGETGPGAGARVEEPRSWVPVIALGAASAVGLGVAVGFTVAANKASADGDRQHAMLRQAGGGCVDVPDEYSDLCSGLRDSASRHETRTRTATVAYVASGALAIGAMTYALWPRAQTATSRGMRTSLELSPGRAGVVVRGVW